MPNSLAIITARGGSKRIPGKNIKEFLGRPIIAYSIEAALKSTCFNEVMVSTDSEEIANIAKACGAQVPFLRSDATSGDFSSTAAAISEVLSEYQKIGRTFDYCCGIYPTAPFVTASRLQQAHNLIISSAADSVVPIVKFSYPILRSLKLENGWVKLNWPEYRDFYSQQLPPAYHDCGQFYFLKVPTFLSDPKLFYDKTIGMELPESEVQDIDNEEDWKIAEMKYSFLMNKNVP